MSALTMRSARGAGGEVRHIPTLSLVPTAPAKRAKKARHVPDPIKTNGDSAAEQVRLLIERLERLHEEKDGISQDIADVLAEARGRGFDTKAIEGIRKIRKKDRALFDEETAILETYMQSLGML